MIVVVDTNVWISALRSSNPQSTPYRALQRAVRQDTIATSLELQMETFRILTQKFGWPEDRTARLLEVFLDRAVKVQLAHAIKVCRDSKDNMFLECASLAKADYLVAGDKDLLVLGSYAGTRIITPREYVDLPTGTDDLTKDPI